MNVKHTFGGQPHHQFLCETACWSALLYTAMPASTHNMKIKGLLMPNTVVTITLRDHLTITFSEQDH